MPVQLSNERELPHESLALLRYDYENLETDSIENIIGVIIDAGYTNNAMNTEEKFYILIKNLHEHKAKVNLLHEYQVDRLADWQLHRTVVAIRGVRRSGSFELQPDSDIKGEFSAFDDTVFLINPECPQSAELVSLMDRTEKRSIFTCGKDHAEASR